MLTEAFGPYYPNPSPEKHRGLAHLLRLIFKTSINYFFGSDLQFANQHSLVPSLGVI